MSVDLFHGSLSVHIPLYTLRSQYLSVGLSLHYSVPGDSHQDIYHPGWVGLGWRLSAGGAITRNIRGLPDESSCHVSNYFYPLRDESSSHQQDQFHFNFCGHSGSFFYHEGQLILDTKSRIVSLLPVWTSSGGLRGFTVLTPEGTLYTFGCQNGAIEQSRTVKSHTSEYQGFLPTAWYLSRIESAEGDFISFTYDHGTQICSLADHNNHSTIEAVFQPDSGGPGVHYYRPGSYQEERTGTFILPSYLSRISCNGLVEVEFERSVALEKGYPLRYLELNDSTGFFHGEELAVIESARWYKLTCIKMKDLSSGRYFKRFDLSYQEDAAQVLLLSGVRERGLSSAGFQESLPGYRFEYGLQPRGVLALSRLFYPTGGYVDYHYDVHLYSDGGRSYQGDKGVRVERILTYPSSGEEAWVTSYFYSGGVLGRKKHTVKEAVFGMGIGSGRGSVSWKKTTDYDMSSSFLGAPVAGKVGYSTVEVVKSKGSHTGDLYTYTFSNYSGNLDRYGQRLIYGKVGLLLSVASSLEKTEYEYDAVNAQQVNYPSVEYMPFLYSDRKVYTKQYAWTYYFRHVDHQVKRIKKHVQGALDDVLQESVYSYHRATKNLVREETFNRKENISYVTVYRYPCEDLHHNSIRNINIPFEVVRYRNGKVVSARVTEFYSYLSGNSHYLRAKKQYVYSGGSDSTSYVPCVYLSDGSVLKSGSWKEVVSYDYYSDGMLKQELPYGGLASVYIWDDYHRLLSVSTGAMDTSYEYCIHGVTKVTHPNGLSQTTEYNSLGQPVLVRDGDGNILEKREYRYNLN